MMNKEAYLESLKTSHADLDEMIKDLGLYPGLQVQALKKKKLILKEKILELENELNEIGDPQ